MTLFLENFIPVACLYVRFNFHTTGEDRWTASPL